LHDNHIRMINIAALSVERQAECACPNKASCDLCIDRRLFHFYYCYVQTYCSYCTCLGHVSPVYILISHFPSSTNLSCYCLIAHNWGMSS
jgi:hypothetical protein